MQEPAAKPKSRVDQLHDQWRSKFIGKTFVEIEAIVSGQGSMIQVGCMPEFLAPQVESHVFDLRLITPVGREKRMVITALHSEKIDAPRVLSAAYVLKDIAYKRRHELDDDIIKSKAALGKKNAIVKLFTSVKDKKFEEGLSELMNEIRKASLDFNDTEFRHIVSELVKTELRGQGPEQVEMILEQLKVSKDVYEAKLGVFEQRFTQLGA